MRSEIADLDAALADVGQDIVLRRIVGKGANAQNVDVTCRAVVRPVDAKQLIGTITQTDLSVVISPTQIIEAQWPGGQPVSGAQIGDRRVPTTDDKILIFSVHHQIVVSKPIYVGRDLVRIDLIIKG